MSMPRNRRFDDDRIPLRNHESLRLVHSKINGPVSFLNPTQAQYQHEIKQPLVRSQDSEQSPDTASVSIPSVDHVTAANVEYKWTSRDNRKGRHTLTVKPASVEHPETNVQTPRPTTHWRSVLHVIWLMITTYPIWDVSWCVAYIFTVGSVLWVINSFFVFLPFLKPSATFHNEVLVGGGVTAFIGATIFEIGSILLMLEAINENREGCFGWAVEEAYEEYFARVEDGHRGDLKIVPNDQACFHHHANKHNLVGKPKLDVRDRAKPIHSDKENSTKNKSWSWCPSWPELKNHYFHELGFIASLSQLLGATIFWISGFTALPGIFNVMSPGLVDGIYWVPQVVGGTGFIISGWLFMIETQKHWWMPAPRVLGWHIGFWNLVGGIGFTLCPAFGFDPKSWAQYQASCSTFWGSWAFLIGSAIQWYESLDKSPVRAEAAG